MSMPETPQARMMSGLKRTLLKLQIMDSLDKSSFEQNLKELIDTHGHDGSVGWDVVVMFETLADKISREYARDIAAKVAGWAHEAKGRQTRHSSKISGFTVLEHNCADRWCNFLLMDVTMSVRDRLSEAGAISQSCPSRFFTTMSERVCHEFSRSKEPLPLVEW